MLSCRHVGADCGRMEQLDLQKRVGNWHYTCVCVASCVVCCVCLLLIASLMLYSRRPLHIDMNEQCGICNVRVCVCSMDVHDVCAHARTRVGMYRA